MTIIDQIEHFLKVIHVPGDLLHIQGRHPVTQRIGVGIYDNPRDAARGAALLSVRHGMNVGFGTCPVNPGSWYAGKRERNMTYHWSFHSLTEAAINTRGTYMIDCDPVRPSGCASTDAEKEAAWAVAQSVIADLTARGWPEPIVMDSGNGYHLYYRADRVDSAFPQWAFATKYLASVHDTDLAKIDTACHSPNRHGRVPGLLNIKGEATEERPHRRAAIVQMPEEFGEVSHMKVIALAELLPGYNPKPRQSSEFKSRWGLVIDDEGMHDLIAEYPDHLLYEDSEERADGTYYYLSICPFKGAPHHNQSKKTAIILSEDMIRFKCFAGSCDGFRFWDLLSTLQDETGRKPETEIWHDPTYEEQIEAWGGVDDLSVIDPIETKEEKTMTEKQAVTDQSAATYVHKRFILHADDEIVLEDLTWTTVKPHFKEVAGGEYERIRDAREQADFKATVEKILKDRDIDRAAIFLGREMVEDIKWFSCTNRAVDPRFTEREVAEQDAESWTKRAVPLPPGLTASDLVPEFQRKAQAVDAKITNYHARELHRHLIKKTLRTRDLQGVANFLGYRKVEEIAELAGVTASRHVEDIVLSGWTAATPVAEPFLTYAQFAAIAQRRPQHERLAGR